MKSVDQIQSTSVSENQVNQDSYHYLQLNPSTKDWLSFVGSKPDTNIFHHPQWTNFLSECYRFRPFIIAVKDKHGNLCAGLPMMEIQNPVRGRRWVSLPFTDHCIPLYNDARSLDKLIEHLALTHQLGKTPQTQLRWNLPGYASVQPSTSYYFHQLELSVDFDSVAARIHPMHRRNARAAQKKGVQIIQGTEPEHIHAFYQLHLQTRQRQGVPIQPKRFFELLGKKILDQGLGFILLARIESQYLAGAVFLHWQKTLTYKFGASNSRFLSLRPNDLIFWTAIQWGCENNYSVLDLGRTDVDNPGLCEFKLRWGAQETCLTYYQISKKPPKTMQGGLMRTMKFMIQKSPSWVCQLVGELLYKYSV